MPRTGQIIPEWIQPHEAVYINDNTFFEDYTADNSGPTFLCVFTSPKGRNQLQLKKSFTDFVNEYGLPDYQTYGQAMYMPYVALFTGNAKAQCLRVTADNATYAHFIQTVSYKVEAGKLKLKFETFKRDDVTDLNMLEIYANAMSTNPVSGTEEEKAAEWKRRPLFSFAALGPGKYGRDFRIRVTHDRNADRDNEYKNYRVELISTEKGTKKLESYNVCFYIDALDPNTQITNYIDDVINDEGGKGSSRVSVKFYYDTLLEVFNEYKKVYDRNGFIPPTVVSVDRRPATTATLPDPEVVYYMAETDTVGGRTINQGTYVKYDNVNKTYNDMTFAHIENTLTTLPTYDDAQDNFLYMIPKTPATDPVTYDYFVKADTSTGGVGGNGFIQLNVVEAKKLPATKLAEEGIYYLLTADDGNFANGTYLSFTNDNGLAATTLPTPVAPENELPYTMETFDIFGYNRFTEQDDKFIEIEGGKSTIHVMDIEGVGLEGGSDGDFDPQSGLSKQERQQAIDKAYQMAFQGGKDAKVNSKRRAPVDLILDANYSVQTKKAMAALALKRMDAAVRLDTNLLTNVNDVFTMGQTLKDINTFMVSKNAGMFKTVDPITGKVIPVTNTLWMAQRYPLHVATYGNHVPMAGERYATLSGYTKNSIRPLIDADDMEIKEKLLTEYQINYIEAIDEDTYIRGTQNTSQVKNSDLSEENNVQVLLEIKRKIERMAGKRRYEFSDEDELRIFRQDCEEIFSSYKGTKCRSIDVQVSMNKWERTRSIVHVYLAIVFRTFQKRAIIEIDVNPRT
jgi:hypothetical protein|nr:MAG TPA: tail sheath protein [Myoviridae sp. ctNPX13]